MCGASEVASAVEVASTSCVASLKKDEGTCLRDGDPARQSRRIAVAPAEPAHAPAALAPCAAAAAAAAAAAELAAARVGVRAAQASANAAATPSGARRRPGRSAR
eukprot:6201323-Pleurochrysis_carterae.AAC.1